MIGLRECDIENSQIHDDIVFPLGLSPAEDLSLDEAMHKIEDNKDKLNDLLIKHAVIIFRGFPINTPQDFERFLGAFGWTYGKYMGGNAPRIKITDNIYTSTEIPHTFPILMHHEMAYLPNSPSKIALWCQLPSQTDGETPICLSNPVYKKMLVERKDFVDKVTEKGVRYHKMFYDGNLPSPSLAAKSWQDAFFTTDRTEAEKECIKGKNSFKWMEDGTLERISSPLPGIRMHPVTKKVSWFNNIHYSHPASWGRTVKQTQFWVTYGDGEEVAAYDAIYASKQLWDNSVMHKWQKGDIMIVDNNAALHGRNIFTPPRSVLVALSD